MQRRRTIAASPVRSAAEAWTVIANLVAITLGASSAVDEADVSDVFNKVAPAGIALVAGGHLGRAPLGVVAAEMVLSIWTASGVAAFDASADEQGGIVPGAATATDWMIHVPRPDLLGALVDDAVAGVQHVTTDPIPQEPAKAARSAAPAFDLRRLDPNARS